MKKIIPLFIIAALLLSACSTPARQPVEPAATQETAKTPVATLAPTPEPAAKPTPDPTPTPEPTPMPDMEATSSGIIDGVMADAYGAKGEQFSKGIPTLSLPLKISYIPDETKTLALTIIDPDGGNWVHWLAANIEVDGNELDIPENASIDNKDSMIQGKNDFGPIGYGGPTPPSGTHKYIITVYALDTQLDLKNGFSLKQLNNAIKDHVLAQAVVTGDYSRK